MTDTRLGFDNVPEVYDRVRPSYPASLFDDLLAYLGRPPDAPLRAAEIGPGTGQATASLLERGIGVTAVEIGPKLAAFLREKFADEERLTVINASFEDVQLQPESYDLVVTATAFHWVDPAVRWTKSRDLLRPTGALAVIGTNQIESDADRGFFDRVQPVYQKYQRGERGDVPGEDVVPVEHGEMGATRLFHDVTLRRYRWDQTYSSAEYADLVRSYSNTQEMAPEAAEALIRELCEVIDQEFGGSITRPLVITLTTGRR